MNTLAQVVTAFSPLLVAVVVGLFAARERRQTSSAKVMARLTAEAGVHEALPEGSAARSIVAAQLEATASKYKATCEREDSFRRDKVGLVAGIILGGGGLILGTWAALQGGGYLWWFVLALPAIMIGVPGFFVELAGGSSRDAARPNGDGAEPPTASGSG
ncbi:hypothetical protein [Streptomyces rimosus]|uniref:hypothetical protein n=1 Tax=Streptomyces rimosus TaxID=1927 RepID=UPI0013316779|nr:hypothetical protein [Streptomyces rimosus]